MVHDPRTRFSSHSAKTHYANSVFPASVFALLMLVLMLGQPADKGRAESIDLKDISTGEFPADAEAIEDAIGDVTESIKIQEEDHLTLGSLQKVAEDPPLGRGIDGEAKVANRTESPSKVEQSKEHGPRGHGLGHGHWWWWYFMFRPFGLHYGAAGLGTSSAAERSGAAGVAAKTAGGVTSGAGRSGASGHSALSVGRSGGLSGSHGSSYSTGFQRYHNTGGFHSRMGGTRMGGLRMGGMGGMRIRG